MKLQKKSLCLSAILSIVGTLAAWAVAQVVVEQSEVTSLLTDPLQFIDSSQKAPVGTLLYVASVKQKNERIRQRYLVLHQAGVVPGAEQRAVYHVKIPASVPEVVFDAQFLSDGRTILFKAGWPYDNPGYYQFYFWDLTNKILKPGPDERLSYRRLFPSSDGNFVAYYRGADAEGNDQGGNRTLPLQLFVYNRTTGKSVKVIQNPAAKFAAWTKRNTLLYSAINQSEWLVDSRRSVQPSANLQNSTTQPDVAARPDIFEVSSSGGTPKLLLKDGYKPAPSPDDQWIAFFTSTDAAQQINPLNAFDLNFPRQSYLCLFNRASNQRYIIRSVSKNFPQIVWTSDSQQLILLEQTYQGSQGKARIFSIDVASRTQKEVATLTAVDFEPASRDTLEPQFQILGVSKDSGNIFVKVSEFISQGKIFINERKSLESIDMKSGELSNVAKILNQQASSLGMDWDSDATISNVVAKANH